LERSKENLGIQRWVVIIAISLFILKIFAYYLTKSVAVLTDALESTVNVISGIIGWYSLYIAAKPSDEDHPYGHGKAEFLSAAIEGTLIMVASCVVVYESIYHLVFPKPLEKLDQGLLLIAISALINFAMGFIASRIGKRNNSLALEASGRHLQSDTYSTLAIIIGLGLIYFTGKQYIDSIVGLLMAAWLFYIGYRITRRSIAGIMDEADEKILARMVYLLNQHRQSDWIDIHNFRVIKYGSVLHVDCHLTVPWYDTVREAQEIVERLTELIVKEFGESMEFFVHEDACTESSCPICSKLDCPVRIHPFEKRIDWTLSNIITNRKHELPEAPDQ
jgi:cation diffusion facilitator family transporter